MGERLWAWRALQDRRQDHEAQDMLQAYIAGG